MYYVYTITTSPLTLEKPTQHVWVMHACMWTNTHLCMHACMHACECFSHACMHYSHMGGNVFTTDYVCKYISPRACVTHSTSVVLHACM